MFNLTMSHLSHFLPFFRNAALLDKQENRRIHVNVSERISSFKLTAAASGFFCVSVCVEYSISREYVCLSVCSFAVTPEKPRWVLFSFQERIFQTPLFLHKKNPRVKERREEKSSWKGAEVGEKGMKWECYLLSREINREKPENLQARYYYYYTVRNNSVAFNHTIIYYMKCPKLCNLSKKIGSTYVHACLT